MKRIFAILLFLANIAYSQPINPPTIRTQSPFSGIGTLSNPLRLLPCVTAGQIYVWNGTAWVCTASNTNTWSILGNASTVQSTNFLGTTDNIGLSFRTNNTLRQTITNDGNVGIGIASPTTLLNVQNTASTNANVALFKSLNGAGGYAVRGESVNAGGALGVYGELGAWDGTRWSGVRGNSGISTSPSVTGFNTVADGTSAYFNQRVAIGLPSPTSTLHVIGSQASSAVNIVGTTVLNATQHKILVSNGGVNIIITLPDALTCLGREYVISRGAGSTGSITLQTTGGNTIQALAGTTGATTSIGNHNANGAGLSHKFTAMNIGGVGVWVRM